MDNDLSLNMELRRLYHERLDETNIEIERESNRSQVTDLLQKTNTQIDLADYLPEALAAPITQWCLWLNIRPAVALTALLASASSLHKTGTEIVLKRNWNFRVPPTIFAALVSPSGQKKSPILKNMEMAIQLARFYIGQVKVIHANSDDDSLPSHILKMIELSKRLEANGKSGWLKAKQVQETFSKKKRPPAQTVRDWMNEAVNMGYGQTRNSGNRLEYYWNKDDGDNDPNSDPSPNLGTLEEPWEKTTPQAETTNHQGIEDNTGNLGNNFSSHLSSFEDKESPPENNPNNNKDDLTQSCLEGDVNSRPSPILTQDAHNQELESVSAVEDDHGNDSPTISQIPQECDNSTSGVTVEAIAPVHPTPVEKEEVAQEQTASGAELAQSESNVENVGEVGKTYLVHQDVDGCIEWVEAVLIDVPNPPLSTGWIFMRDGGQQFPVFDRGSFR